MVSRNLLHIGHKISTLKVHAPVLCKDEQQAFVDQCFKHVRMDFFKGFSFLQAQKQHDKIQNYFTDIFQSKILSIFLKAQNTANCHYKFKT